MGSFKGKLNVISFLGKGGQATKAEKKIQDLKSPTENLGLY